MSRENKKIESFTDLNSWKESHELTLEIYKTSKSFPKDEQYALLPQIRRAAVSIVSNIAEGFGRSSAADRTHFYTMALGSIREVQSQLLVAKDLNYIDRELFAKIAQQAITAQKLTTGLVKSTKNMGNS